MTMPVYEEQKHCNVIGGRFLVMADVMMLIK